MISVEWDTDNYTRLLISPMATASTEDYLSAIEGASSMICSVSYPVDAIWHLRGVYVYRLSARRLGRHLIDHRPPNLRHTVLVSPDDWFFASLIGVAERLFGQSVFAFGENVFTASSVADARAFLSSRVVV